MALVLHITMALAFYYIYNHQVRGLYDKWLGVPTHAGDWVGVYSKALLLLVLIPFVCTESLIMALSSKEYWHYNRTVILLPHFFNVVIDRRINRLIRNVLKS